MERAFFSRDASYDGLFFTGVRTTSVFCRPSCSARKPKPENIRFFPSAPEALFAGFRPCRRCHPLETSVAPDWLERVLEAVDQAPGGRLPDAALRRLDLEPARVRRHFQRAYGMTFQAYCRARRLGAAFAGLREGTSIDDAVFDHGYESHSGFRAAFHKLFGTSPGRSRTPMQPSSRARQPRTTLAVTRWIESPLGPLLAAATDEGICLLEFSDRRALERQTAALARILDSAVVPGDHPHLDRLEKELGEYFAGARRRFEVPVVIAGSPFQEAVWRALLAIPCGETRSYEDLARQVSKPGGSRAVGQANGSNRIAIVVPCHRVVNKSGRLGGYGGGRWRKEWLLALERGESADALAAARLSRQIDFFPVPLADGTR
jgi:AraC family transcriptional regulator of adaptative response/methylated-DNA-[protein]-cysteine methyltransferase